MLNDNESGINKLATLNGHIIILPGNHDTSTRQALYDTIPNVEVIKSSIGIAAAISLKYKKYNFVLSHIPMLASNYDEDKPLKARTINICGHVHTTDPFFDSDKGLIYHVELDAHNCYPIEIDKVIEDLK